MSYKVDYECPECEHKFEFEAYEEGECPQCGLRFELEDDLEGRCLPIWENCWQSSYYKEAK